jgi:2-keto-4-pentenoate hydratase
VPNPKTVITDKELKAATKLAGRKGGATRHDLAERLGISVPRAANVFAKAKIEATSTIGRGRTLVYTA